MTIHTKYNRGDIVYFYDNIFKEIQSGKIVKITIHYYGMIVIIYEINTGESTANLPERRLFLSKEELISTIK